MIKPVRPLATALASLSLLFLAACGGSEARLAGYLERGDAYFAERNYEKARVEFSNALQIDPANAQTRFMVGQVTERLNNPRDAVGHYRAVIEADPGHVAARAALGRLYLFGGLADLATELVEPGLVTAPENPQLLTVRGAARAQLGDTAGAMEDARLAIAGAPGDEYAIALLASLHRQAGQAGEAITVVRRGIELLPENVDLRVVLADLEMQQKNPEGAEEQLRKAAELQPEVVAHWQRLARFYVGAGKSEPAEQAMRDGIAAMPDNLDAKLALVEFLAAQRGGAAAEEQMATFMAADKDDEQMQLAFGRFHESRGNLDRAEALYREVIDQAGTEPSGLTARNRVAALLARKNDTAGAEALIAEVLQENASDNDALVLRANLALARNDAPAAIGDLRSVLRDQPNAPPVMRALAQAHVQNNELALAEETLRTASAANPQDAPTRLDLASILLRTGRLDQARPLLEKLVSESPANLQAAEGLFRVQVGMNDLGAARTTAEGLQSSRPDLGIGFYFAAMMDEAARNPDAARTGYEAALQRQPDSAEPLAALVRLDVGQNQRARAIERLETVISQFPDNVIARNLKGEVLTADQQFAEAQAVFSEAIAKAPQWWMPYRGLAIAKIAAGDIDGATAALDEGFDKTGGAFALASDLAALYERTQRADEAIKVYERVVAKNPGSIPAANNLAMLLVSYRSDAASLDRARQLADQLTASTEASYVNTRGWVMYKRGEYQEALPLLQQAVNQSPDSPVMRYHLGMAQLKLGDKEAARQNLEQAIRSERAFAGIEEARSALEEANRAG